MSTADEGRQTHQCDITQITHRDRNTSGMQFRRYKRTRNAKLAGIDCPGPGSEELSEGEEEKGGGGEPSEEEYDEEK